ncbi:MAG TPA: sensor histidine kinase [Thermotogota bacterium]|nr:sensor histidine kinase [Thermotogota bacterium]HRW92187.1 sensor histidine kinase [Thermotogota bacterium]
MESTKSRNYVNIINGIQYLFFFFTFLCWVIFTPQKTQLSSFLIMWMFFTFTVRHFIFFPRRSLSSAKLLMLLDLVAVYWLSYNDPHFFHFYFFDALIAESVVFYTTGFSLRFLAYTIGVCSLNIYLQQQGITMLFRNLISFTLVYGFMFMVKDLNDKRKFLFLSRKMVHDQAQLLEKANENLRQSGKALEEMTILRERNRIAREIHDSVGHALTAVIIQMEAAKRLIEKNPANAQQKIDTAQEQVRNGLESIRRSVRTLKEGRNVLDLQPALEALILETEANTGVKIHRRFNTIPALKPELEKAIYSSLQEGLTNGIRHGNAGQFHFSLTFDRPKLQFDLSDDGAGFSKLSPGFGLTVMKERANELGGKFSIRSQPGKGCYIQILFILSKEAYNEPGIDTNAG